MEYNQAKSELCVKAFLSIATVHLQSQALKAHLVFFQLGLQTPKFFCKMSSLSWISWDHLDLRGLGAENKPGGLQLRFGLLLSGNKRSWMATGESPETVCESGRSLEHELRSLGLESGSSSSVVSWLCMRNSCRVITFNSKHFLYTFLHHFIVSFLEHKHYFSPQLLVLNNFTATEKLKE